MTYGTFHRLMLSFLLPLTATAASEAADYQADSLALANVKNKISAWDRLHVGGYGEVAISRNFFSDNYLRYSEPERYRNAGSHGRFDLPHVVVYLGYDFG